jgi:hypothetical protein
VHHRPHPLRLGLPACRRDLRVAHRLLATVTDARASDRS